MVVCAVGPAQEAHEYRKFKDSLGWIVLSGLCNKTVSTFLTLNIREIIRQERLAVYSTLNEPFCVTVVFLLSLGAHEADVSSHLCDMEMFLQLSRKQHSEQCKYCSCTIVDWKPERSS